MDRPRPSFHARRLHVRNRITTEHGDVTLMYPGKHGRVQARRQLGGVPWTRLRAAGIALMTIKLRPHNRRRVMDHSFRILRKAYQIVRVRQLVNNRSEVTLFLRKRLT